MNARRWPIVAALVLVAGLLSPATATAVQPDVLDDYTIAIAPQPDGTLLMDYTLTGYHAMSDWPADQPYLQIGVPNDSFSILHWGASANSGVVRADARIGNGSFVEFGFDTLPLNGAVFDLRFTIRQGKMAYPNAGASDVMFQFVPAGWTFPIKVNRLTVTWESPTNPALLKSVQPAAAYGDGSMTWSWDHPGIDSNGMFSDSSIQLVYDASAFTLSDAGTGPGGVQPNDGNAGGYGGSGSDAGQILFLFIVIGVIVVSIARGAGGDGYHGGPGLHPGAYGRGGTGFVHSCACACAGCACACACACAGGGKVGCSRKAIGIACLPGVIRSLTGRPETT